MAKYKEFIKDETSMRPTKIIRIMDDHDCYADIIKLTHWENGIEIDSLYRIKGGVCLSVEQWLELSKAIKEFKKEIEELEKNNARYNNV